MAKLAPDAIGVTAITPSIYKAEGVLKIASEVVPKAVRVLGGVHATFMYKQVLSEAPWVDVIVRARRGDLHRTDDRHSGRALAGRPLGDQGPRLP